MSKNYTVIYIVILEKIYNDNFKQIIKHIQNKTKKSTIIIRVLKKHGQYKDVVIVDGEEKIVSC